MITLAERLPHEYPVSWSRLKYFAQSPAHYLHALTKERKDTPAMQLGRLVDTLLFDGPNGRRTGELAIWSGDRRQGKAWDAFAEENDGREIVTVTQMERALAMVESIKRHPVAEQVLIGQRYSEIQWRWLGRDCVSHPDLVGGTFVTDLKTSVTSQPFRFRSQALRQLYHSQLAFYRLALRSVGVDIRAAYIVAVEVTEPYPVTVFEAMPRALDAGERACRSWFETLLQCEASGDWPGYTQAIESLDVDEDVELIYADEED